MKINDKTLTLRPVVLPDDEEFLVELYYTTRDDIGLSTLDETQKKMLSLMQYLAQKQHYAEQFPDTNHDIILLGGKSIGRFWTARYEKEIVGVDLAVLPEYRRFGIGTFLLQKIFDEAAQTERIFNFHVLRTNTAAIRLYERLNCQFVGETVSHFQMRWQAEASKK